LKLHKQIEKKAIITTKLAIISGTPIKGLLNAPLSNTSAKIKRPTTTSKKEATYLKNCIILSLTKSIFLKKITSL